MLNCYSIECAVSAGKATCGDVDFLITCTDASFVPGKPVFLYSFLLLSCCLQSSTFLVLEIRKRRRSVRFHGAEASESDGRAVAHADTGDGAAPGQRRTAAEAESEPGQAHAPEELHQQVSPALLLQEFSRIALSSKESSQRSFKRVAT